MTVLANLARVSLFSKRIPTPFEPKVQIEVTMLTTNLSRKLYRYQEQHQRNITIKEVFECGTLPRDPTLGLQNSRKSLLLKRASL